MLNLPSLNARVLFPLAERLSGRIVSARVEWLRQEFARAWPERQRRNRARLVEMLQNAHYEIPYYRDLFNKIRFQPEKVLTDIRYFEQLPVLTKEDLREAGERILHPQCKAFLPVDISRTNGSTGSALPVYYTPTSKDYSAAVTRLSQAWVGFTPDKLQLHISSAYPGETPELALRQEWWRRQATNRLSIECDAWSDEGLAKLWQQVQTAHAWLVQCHPSTLYALARYVERIGDAKHCFEVFVSTGESLSKTQRERIERVFSCRVANRYGNAEFGIIAHENFSASADIAAKHYLQVIDSYVWVETLSIDKAERSSLLVTDLTNMSSPLIRYATGDEASLVKGAEGIYLTPVSGRVHDLINVNGTSYPTHWFQDIFTRLGNVEDFQFVRAADGTLELRMSLIDRSGEEAMRAQLQQWIPADAFTLRFVPRREFIRVGRQQKFRYLVDVQPEEQQTRLHDDTAWRFEGDNSDTPYLLLFGWNDEEVVGEHSYRWMRKRGDIAVNPALAGQTLHIEYAYPADAKEFPRLKVFNGQACIHEAQISPGAHWLTIPLPASPAFHSLLTLELNRLYPVPADSRELGLKVHSIKVEP